MSHMLQLNPSIPVHVIDKGMGEAIVLIDYGKEDNLLFVVAMDNSGEIWIEPSNKIRLLNNYSIGREYKINGK